jgi:hypothetical protein
MISATLQPNISSRNRHQSISCTAMLANSAGAAKKTQPTHPKRPEETHTCQWRLGEGVRVAGDPAQVAAARNRAQCGRRPRRYDI